MKKVCFAVLLCVFLLAVIAASAQAYTINDPASDRIGDAVFETYGINVSDIYNTGGFTIGIYTNYPQAGYTVGSWVTQPADLFITETYNGSTYLWALVLKDHDGFSAGTMYAVGSYLTSDDLAPSSGYTYNHDVPVYVETVGNNYGYTEISGSTVVWNTLASGDPDYQISIAAAFYEDDPTGSLAFRWGTGTCANDVISGTVSATPIPGSLLFLGTGLVGLVGVGIRHKACYA
ncbi:MAG: hypothetical protein PHF35_03355 [Candidatus Moranbacteria bacterium]|nr:hypothetical protein [Candidatus Moranbacteria bacterium]